jgi:hypothetical protein
MEFSRLLEKLGRGQRLSEAEIFELRLHAQAIEETKSAVKGWLKPGTTNPVFQTMSAGEGHFSYSPVDGMFLTRSVAQTIPDDTITTVEFDSTTPNTNILLSSGVDGRLQVARSHELIAAIGAVHWEANGTGLRSVHLDLYDQDDVGITGYVLHNMQPSGSFADILPFSGGVYIPGVDNIKYLRLTVRQTSGGDLDLNDCRLFLFALR